MKKKSYINPTSEIQEVLTERLLGNDGISGIEGTGSGSTGDGQGMFGGGAPERKVFYKS